MCVEHNCTFVIGLENVGNVIDLRADDGGVWKHGGVRKSWIIADETTSFKQ